MNIRKPTLLLDEEKCRENIRRMILKAKKHGVDFRPHFKTHQSLEIGRWFKEMGTYKITVSSLQMAEYFSEEWDDITVAFPVNIPEIDTINMLAAKVKLNLLIESEESILFLKENLKSGIGYFIKIDLGSHRTGIDPADTDSIENILKISENSDKIEFKGFLGHAGHTYHCGSKEEILKIQNNSLDIMKNLKEKYISRYPELIISTGDTPGCSISDNFSGTDEIRPGNFVFYDLMQLGLGSNTADQIAVAVACPVVAIHKERNELVIYGGGIHFSKEKMENEAKGEIYGRAVEKLADGWGEIIPEMYVKSLSQEHGIVSMPEKKMSDYKVGDILLILPVHSCMTADCMNGYLKLDSSEVLMMG